MFAEHVVDRLDSCPLLEGLRESSNTVELTFTASYLTKKSTSCKQIRVQMLCNIIIVCCFKLKISCLKQSVGVQMITYTGT